MLKEITRKIKNLGGLVSGYCKCMFCGDRANWKHMADVIRVTNIKGHEVTFLPCICKDCMESRPLEHILQKVNTGISDINRIYCSYGCEPCYTGADRELIIHEITKLKEPERFNES